MTVKKGNRRRWAAVAAGLPVLAAAGFAGAVRLDAVDRPPGWPAALSPPAVDARGCPTGEGDAITDWVAFLRFGGRSYLARLPGEEGETVPRDGTAGVIGKITCSLPSTGTGDIVSTDSYPDGTAPFVPVGTPIHAVAGLPPECAVALELHGELTVYRAVVESPNRPEPACPGA